MQQIWCSKLEYDDIRKKRSEISSLMEKESEYIENFELKVLQVSDLQYMFKLYDRIFLNNWFREEYKGEVIFSLSRRMTRSAGLTICSKTKNGIIANRIEIRIGVDFFSNYNIMKGSTYTKVAGIEPQNGLEALQLVFEHELCHALEFITYSKSSCKGKRFKTLALNLFGHTESTHGLPSNRAVASSFFGLKVGDSVIFSFEGKMLNGIISNINKRATVMVRDRKGHFADRWGRKYSKYYVPLSYFSKQN